MPCNSRTSKNFSVHTIKSHDADGNPRVYHYNRMTRVRIWSEPGTPEFEVERELAAFGHRTKAGRRLIASRRDHPTPTNVYVIAAPATGLLKVGRAANVAKRFATLQTGSAEPLALLGWCPDTSGGLLEPYIHEQLKDHLVKGEWFTDCPAVRAWLGHLTTFRWLADEEPARSAA